VNFPVTKLREKIPWKKKKKYRDFKKETIKKKYKKKRDFDTEKNEWIK
jgi:hypothetical protein